MIESDLAIARRAAAIAVHESGHAVAARALQIRAGRISLHSTPGRDGDIAEAGAWFDSKAGLRTIKCLLAGRAAVDELIGDVAEDGCAFDDSSVARLLEALGFQQIEPVRDALLLDTRALVRKQAGAVALVALNLIAKRELSADEIDRLIESESDRALRKARPSAWR
jgi:hypothetical protein